MYHHIFALINQEQSMELNRTWSLEQLPDGKTAIESKWVFTIKFRSSITIERYKTRLIVLDNR